MISVLGIVALVAFCVSICFATYWFTRQIFCSCADGKVEEGAAKSKRNRRKKSKSATKQVGGADVDEDERMPVSQVERKVVKEPEAHNPSQSKPSMLIDGEGEDASDLDDERPELGMHPRKGVVVDIPQMIKRQAEEGWTPVSKPSKTAKSTIDVSPTIASNHHLEVEREHARAAARQRKKERKKTEAEIVRAWERTHL